MATFVDQYIAQNPIMIEKFISTSTIIIGAYIVHLILIGSIVKVTNTIANKGKVGEKINHPRLKTLRGLMKNVIGIVVWGIAFVMILSLWGVDILPIVTGAGILGLAIGFGSQTLVKDIVTGFFLLLENQYNVGDYVEIAGVKGRVRRMNLRTTILKDDDGTISIIPNSAVVKVVKYTDEQVEKMKLDIKAKDEAGKKATAK